MVDKAEVIELAEEQVARLIKVCHKNGLTYREILRIFLIACQDLFINEEVEVNLG